MVDFRGFKHSDVPEGAREGVNKHRGVQKSKKNFLSRFERGRLPVAARLPALLWIVFSTASTYPKWSIFGVLSTQTCPRGQGRALGRNHIASTLGTDATRPPPSAPNAKAKKPKAKAKERESNQGVSLSDAVDVATLMSTASPESAAPTTVSQGGERKLTSRRHRLHRTFCGLSVTGLPGSLTAVVRDAEIPCAFILADSQAGNTGSRRRGETTISPLDPRLGERTPSGHQIAFTWS
ncbi:hypothetical protein ACOMHN_002770 [Nucella lapillus]